MVLPGEGVEGGQQPGELRLRPAGHRGGDPDQDLHLEKRLGGPELSVERLAPDPLLDELGRRRAAPAAIAAAEEIGELDLPARGRAGAGGEHGEAAAAAGAGAFPA